MLTKIVKFVLSVALLAICQPQACNTQFWQNPYTGSVSRARSSATGHQLGLGGLGFSEGVVDAQTETEANGGIANGGTTSVGNSRSRTGGVNFGGLGVDSTFTRSKTNTNGQVSRGLAHDLNVGGLGLGSSLSRDNLNKGFGVQRSQEGGLQFGLGLLNFNLGKKQQAQAQTQAQAQAQGENAFARADSNSATQSGQFGGLGFARTQSESNALSATNYGQTSANAGGSARNIQGQYRKRRATDDRFKFNNFAQGFANGSPRFRG